MAYREKKRRDTPDIGDRKFDKSCCPLLEVRNQGEQQSSQPSLQPRGSHDWNPAGCVFAGCVSAGYLSDLQGAVTHAFTQ